MSYQTDQQAVKQQLGALDFQIRSCSKKRRHHSEKAALNALAGLKKSSIVIDPESLHIYFCKFCNGYHIGHGKGK